MITARGHATNAELAAAGLAFLVALVFFVGLVVYATRWRRVRGATSRYDALRRAFGERGARRVLTGVFVCAGAMALMAVVVALSGG